MNKDQIWYETAGHIAENGNKGQNPHILISHIISVLKRKMFAHFMV